MEDTAIMPYIHAAMKVTKCYNLDFIFVGAKRGKYSYLVEVHFFRTDIDSIYLREVIVSSNPEYFYQPESCSPDCFSQEDGIRYLSSPFWTEKIYLDDFRSAKRTDTYSSSLMHDVVWSYFEKVHCFRDHTNHQVHCSCNIFHSYPANENDFTFTCIECRTQLDIEILPHMNRKRKSYLVFAIWQSVQLTSYVQWLSEELLEMIFSLEIV